MDSSEDEGVGQVRRKFGKNNVIHDSEESDSSFDGDDLTDKDHLNRKANIRRPPSTPKKSSRSVDSPPAPRKRRKKRERTPDDTISDDELTSDGRFKRSMKELKESRARKKSRIKPQSEEGSSEDIEEPSDVKISSRSFPPQRTEDSAAKRRIVSSESELSNDEKTDDDSLDEEDEDYESDGFVTNRTDDDNEDNEEGANEMLDEIVSSLQRKSSKFQALTDSYEEESSRRQLGAARQADGDTEDERDLIKIGWKVPPKLVASLQAAVEDAVEDENMEVNVDSLSTLDLIHMWKLYQMDEDSDVSGECVCGKIGLRIVGSECINWFCETNKRSSLIAIHSFLKKGCVVRYKKCMKNGSLKLTMEKSTLSDFLLKNRSHHRKEYLLPMKVSTREDGGKEISLTVSPRTKREMKDSKKKPLVVNKKYRAFLKSDITDNNTPSLVKLVALKLEDLENAENKDKSEEDWDSRLSAPVFQTIRMNEYFFELERKFSQEMRGSVTDVDIFANNVRNDIDAEHMEELLFKLRRTPHTINTPPSTGHAALRAMADHGDTNHLLKMLDDRLNYGLFLDEYCCVLLLDKYLEEKKLAAGARLASNLMLQEDEWPLPLSLARLACWRYWASGRQQPWDPDSLPSQQTEEEEVIRVRVKMRPNEYTDHHFDLRDPDKIFGKTMAYLSHTGNDVPANCMKAVGLALFGDFTSLTDLLKREDCRLTEEVVANILESVKEPPAGLEAALKAVKTVECDVEQQLLDQTIRAVTDNEKGLVDRQKELYKKWNVFRDEELQRQYNIVQTNARIEAIKNTKAELAQKEERLFFFDNFDRYEIEKDEKVQEWRKTLPATDWTKFSKKKTPKDISERKPRWMVREEKRGPPK